MTVTVAMLIKYANDKKADMLDTPSDRAEVSRKAVAAMGGKLRETLVAAGNNDEKLERALAPINFTDVARESLANGFLSGAVRREAITLRSAAFLLPT